VQVVGESKFIADMAQYSFDRFVELLLLKLFEIFVYCHFSFFDVVGQLTGRESGL